jgi:uncharacterized protein (TIGR02996 family)
MSDRDALIAAILVNPDEDTPRLMFADWLDEHGDPARAEFIRLQCALAREFEAEADLPDDFGTGHSYDSQWGMSGRPHDTEERLTLLRREQELLIAHAEEWRNGLPEYANGFRFQQSIRFHRGFVGRVCVALGPLIKSPAALWRHHPVDSLLLINGGAARLKIPTCRPLAALRELWLVGDAMAPDMVAPIADCPYLSGLRRLGFGHEVADAAARDLARSPYLKPVTLEFDASKMGEPEFAALMNRPFASRLRRLKVRASEHYGAHVVADAPLTELRRLELRYSSYGDAGVAALTRSKYLTQLVTLDLSNTNLTDAALRALAGWPGLASVRALNLGENREITARGVAELLKSPHLKPIYLGLCWTGTGDTGAKALAEWPGLATLIALDFWCAGVKDTGVLALADSPHWRDIRYLKFGGADEFGEAAKKCIRKRFGACKIDI